MNQVEADDRTPPSVPRPAVRPRGYKLDQWNRQQWNWDDGIFSAWAGITIAGACYVPIAAVSLLVWELAVTGHSNVITHADALPGLGLTMVPVAVLSAVMGFIFGGILLLVLSIPILYLDLHRHAALFGTLIGGMAGISYSVALLNNFSPADAIADRLGNFLILPGLATLCGQIGGGWGICRIRSRRATEPRPLRFRLLSALVFTTWVAAFLGVAQWGLGDEAPWFAPAMVWLVYQFGTAWLVMQLLTWRGLRSARVESALTQPLEC